MGTLRERRVVFPPPCAKIDHVRMALRASDKSVGLEPPNSLDGFFVYGTCKSTCISVRKSRLEGTYKRLSWT